MTQKEFHAWALKSLGFFITPGKFQHPARGKSYKAAGYMYNGQLYGRGIVVFKTGGCHPANSSELKMWRQLEKGFK
jgi:hypothetical protein